MFLYVADFNRAFDHGTPSQPNSEGQVLTQSNFAPSSQRSVDERSMSDDSDTVANLMKLAGDSGCAATSTCSKLKYVLILYVVCPYM